MRKLLNRPTFALAAAFVVVFMFLLMKSYLTVVDNFAEHLPIVSERETGTILVQLQNPPNVEGIRKTQLGPELPHVPVLPKPIVNTEITLGYICHYFSPLQSNVFIDDKFINYLEHLKQ